VGFDSTRQGRLVGPQRRLARRRSPAGSNLTSPLQSLKAAARPSASSSSRWPLVEAVHSMVNECPPMLPGVPLCRGRPPRRARAPSPGLPARAWGTGKAITGVPEQFRDETQQGGCGRFSSARRSIAPFSTYSLLTSPKCFGAAHGLATYSTILPSHMSARSSSTC
jgi:hypothetical protein